jgi:hypothetical protein
MENAISTAQYSSDTIVNSVINQFIQRAEFGMKKYGTNLDRTDLTLEEWYLHMQQELMDGILYLEKIKQQTEKQKKD